MKIKSHRNKSWIKSRIVLQQIVSHKIMSHQTMSRIMFQQIKYHRSSLGLCLIKLSIID
jgi:hypothetical protein